MGRHSRRGPAPKGGTADPAARADRRSRGGRGSDGRGEARPDGLVPPGRGAPDHGPPAGYGPPAHGVPRLPDGWLPDGTPARGVPRSPDGTPAYGVPRVRGGGHPEQREPGGGWGELRGQNPGAGYPGHPGHPGPAGGGVPLPRQRQAPPGGSWEARGPRDPRGPRQDYLDAFDEEGDLFTPRDPAHRTFATDSAPATDPYAAVTDWSSASAARTPVDRDDASPAGAPEETKGAKGRAFTGIAAAAVTTVLAVVVAGQVADEPDAAADDVQAQSVTDQAARDVRDSGSRGAGREEASSGAGPLTYEQKMEKRYPIADSLAGSGKFDAIPGIDKAQGTGQKFTYRVDVEQGLGLDGELFAEAVQRTLNDNRSWSHNGARVFERVHSGRPDFVITLASPETTADWCARSGLDTTVDNVSCDSAATERVMINAFRWAQGAETYGDALLAYRQMLINHEIGHRLGYNHLTCDRDGDLAPVMQQQTKFLDHDGISCRPNPWPYPKD
ncbi:DUF3152 domain-containing protein [Streptomyces sp. M2CJ-2]|uniref:DUF3152 domain-containing protein n=1 Tax=Streptomyces sp. M2CJ-2 TaxID=2803948 RepID=UPI0019290CFE|nr:DUF3152 domain-containing protein [Streptomyces sp. M2CJ-2]MBL3667116.1 DUF3152 domain-containing protein [Streptomyces sp. M2CJ-2]